MKYFVYGFWFCWIGAVWGQSGTDKPFRCGSAEAEARTLKALGISRQDIEYRLQHMMKKVNSGQPINGWQMNAEEVLTIPLVFHVLYPDDPVKKCGRKEDDRGPYVTDQRVYDQVESLNMHFGHTNPSADDILEAFKGVNAGDTKIRFALARRDPAGMPTTGILRATIPCDYDDDTKGNFWNIESIVRTRWSPAWDFERYINIYVLPEKNMGSLGGLAYFPASNLAGLGVTEIHGYDEGGRLIYLNPPAVWMSELWFHGSPREEGGGVDGSVLVHELGHSLGLLHTFGIGRGACSSDDYCKDTPNQESASSLHIACNISIQQQSCGSLDMVQNYMDYTGPSCWALFSKCQKERMRTVLASSFRRKTLHVNNEVLSPPVATNQNDLGLIALKAPVNVCADETNYEVQVEVGNYGQNGVNSFTIGAYMHGEEVAREKVRCSLLQQWQRYWVTLPPIKSSIVSGRHQLEVRILSVNDGIVDTYAHNNRQTKEVYFVPIATDQVVSFPIENFESSSSKTDHWVLSSSAELVSERQNRKGELNKALVFPFQKIDASHGTHGHGYTYSLYSPILSLPNRSAQSKMPIFRLRYSYTPKKGHFSDGFFVTVASSACGTPRRYIEYHAAGPDIATSWHSDPNTPPGKNEWKQLDIPLQGYAGQYPVQIGVHALHGGGNPLYLDSLEVQYISTSGLRLRVADVSARPIVCVYPPKSIRDRDSLSTLVVAENFSPTSKYSTKISIQSIRPTVDKRNINISVFYPYTTEPYEVAPSVPEFGSYDYAVWYNSGSAPFDSLYHSVTYVNASSPINAYPLVYDFSTSNNLWITQPASTSRKAHYGSAWLRTNGHLMGAFYQSPFRAEYMLLSPLVDYSQRSSVRFNFDVSYAQRTAHIGPSERLRVVVLRNSCDIYSGKVVYDKDGTTLKTVASVTGAWTPTQATDWRKESIDITQYAQSGPIQVLLLASNHGGNHLYIDNVGFGGTDPNTLLGTSLPKPPLVPTTPLAIPEQKQDIWVYPNPSRHMLSIHFPPLQPQSLEVVLFSSEGKRIQRRILAQPTPIHLELPPSARNGTYFLHIQGETFTATRRIIIE